MKSKQPIGNPFALSLLKCIPFLNPGSQCKVTAKITYITTIRCSESKLKYKTMKQLIQYSISSRIRIRNHDATCPALASKQESKKKAQQLKQQQEPHIQDEKSQIILMQNGRSIPKPVCLTKRPFQPYCSVKPKPQINKYKCKYLFPGSW